MTPNQMGRLKALRDRLVETALVDADPQNWSANGKAPHEMTRDERGDAKWCRGLAVQTVALTMQVQRLVEAGGAAGKAADPPAPDDPVASEIQRFESAAAELLAARAVKTAAGRGRQ